MPRLDPDAAIGHWKNSQTVMSTPPTPPSSPRTQNALLRSCECTHTQTTSSATLLLTARNSPGATVSLKITYQGNQIVVEEGSTALIGSGEASQIRIARPGISRRHAVIAFDGTTWKVEDADSRNGTFANGQRIHVATIEAPTTLILGHPTEGEAVTFTPVRNSSATVQDEIDSFLMPDPPPPAPPRAPRSQRTPAAAPATAPVRAASRADATELEAVLRDQIAAIRGLTWSVWGMIGVTAALCVLTLFVGVLGS